MIFKKRIRTLNSYFFIFLSVLNELNYPFSLNCLVFIMTCLISTVNNIHYYIYKEIHEKGSRDVVCVLHYIHYMYYNTNLRHNKISIYFSG